MNKIERKNRRGGRTLNQVRRCAVCLYRVGFGCVIAGRIIRKSKVTVSRWVIEAGVKDQNREMERCSMAASISGAIQRKRRLNRVQGKVQMKLNLFVEVSDVQRKKDANNYYKRNKKRIDRVRKKNKPYMLSVRLRCRIYNVLKGLKKSAPTLRMLGCSAADAKKHIESLWSPGMNWSNYGVHGWHIDHIKPCASFDLSKPEEQSKAFHFTNLQPLWAFENWSKSDRLDWERRCPPTPSENS